MSANTDEVLTQSAGSPEEIDVEAIASVVEPPATEASPAVDQEVAEPATATKPKASARRAPRAHREAIVSDVVVPSARLESEAPAETTPPVAEAAEVSLASTMAGADFEASLQEPSEGDVISGVIVHIDKEGILVDVGAKSEGLVRPNEISRGSVEDDELVVGETIKVVVIGRDKEDGKLLLSKKRADFEKAWDKVVEALEDGRILLAMVTERVKGGLVVDLGIRGFVPASHVGSGDFKHTNLDKFVGQSVPLKVIEVDREKRKVVLSNKMATDEERGKKKKETLDALKEGDIREGIVRRVTDYGAFIDLGGIDGLLHVSEMSWARINHPSEVVKVGDHLQVMILKLRLDQGRISLGMRQILPDPWEGIAETYHVGDTLKTTISRLVPFGAFVMLEGGVEAIIPNSELSARRVSRPQDVVNPGDEIEARVIEVKPEERKMTLSIRRIQEETQRAAGEAAREQEYREFQNYSKKRAPASTGVTLGDVLGEQFARARKEVSRKGKRDKTDYDVEEEE